METDLEKAILEIVNSLTLEQQERVLEFIENLIPDPESPFQKLVDE